MDSCIKEVYKSIIESAKTITLSDGSPQFAYNNIWNNQIEETLLGDTYSFACPALFVEFVKGEPMQLGRGFISYPNGLFRLHFCNLVLDGGAGTMEQNLSIFDIRDRVLSKFNRYGGAKYCSTFMLVEDKEEFSHENLYHYVLGFRSNFIDNRGSDFDDLKSVVGYLTNPTLNLNVLFQWISGIKYIVDKVVVYRGKIYICKTENSDVTFTSSNWTEIKGWQPQTKYLVDSYAVYYSVPYKCVTENSDAVFNEVNWVAINQ